MCCWKRETAAAAAKGAAAAAKRVAAAARGVAVGFYNNIYYITIST